MGDLRKAFDCLSACADMTGQDIPPEVRWFPGTTTELNEFAKKLPTLQGANDIIPLANGRYGSDMFRAGFSVFACARMTGQKMPDGIGLYRGKTREYLAQCDWLVGEWKTTDTAETLRERHISKFCPKPEDRERGKRKFNAIWCMSGQDIVAKASQEKTPNLKV